MVRKWRYRDRENGTKYFNFQSSKLKLPLSLIFSNIICLVEKMLKILLLTCPPRVKDYSPLLIVKYFLRTGSSFFEFFHFQNFQNFLFEKFHNLNRILISSFVSRVYLDYIFGLNRIVFFNFISPVVPFVIMVNACDSALGYSYLILPLVS